MQSIIINPEISIVIPAYKANSTLKHCLNALYSQKNYIPHEVIVVDYLSGAKENDFLNRYPNLKILTQPKPLAPGLMRNAGALIAKGDYLLFIDADIVVDKEIVKNVNAAISKGYNLFSGAIEVSILSKKNIWVYVDHFFNFHEFQPTMKISTRRNLISTIFLIEKKMFFNTNMFGPLQRMEDTEFSKRLKQKGFELYFIPVVKGGHIYNRKIQAVLKKAFINGVNTYSLSYHAKCSSIFRKIFLILSSLLFTSLKTIRIIYRNIRFRKGREKIWSILLIPFLVLCGMYWMFGICSGAIISKGKAWQTGLEA